jgi:carboxylate-amine ligase
MGGHARPMTMRSVGVEEELLLVEPGTGQPRAVAETALRAAGHGEGAGDEADGRRAAGDDVDTLALELQRQQLETNTRPCHDLAELDRELRRCRSLAAEVAGRAGARIAALGTSPAPVLPQLVREGRYLEMARAFGLTAQEQLTCGCHVHVEISSADEGVAVLDRITPWLPVLLALSANSPFWQGRDSEYASFRYQAWGRWPSAGPTEAFGTAEVYRETVRRMVASGTLLDTGMVYFDARLSEHYPTLEIRIADVCLYAGDAVLIAALSRALVETEARRWRAGAGVQHQRIEILRLAGWRASRSGLDDVLLNPLTGRPEPAATVARALLDHVRDALDEAGEAAAVSDLLTAVLARGNGAAFQRSACRDGGMADMIDSAATATTRLTIGGRYPHGGRYQALRRHGPGRRCGRRSGRS